MHRSIAIFLGLALTALATDIAYSPPVGGMTISVPAGQTRSVDLPLLHGSAGVGSMLGHITGVGTNYIDDSSAGWLAGEFNTAANPYYLRIKTGVAAGRVLLVSATANTTTRVFLTNDGVSLTAAGGPAIGDEYELVLADTLGTLFGSTILQGGTDASSADNVQVWSGADWLVFYYNSGRARWELREDTAGSPTRDTFVLRPDRGVMVTRHAATALKFYVTGRVPSVAPRHFHARPGVTFVSDGVPVSVTLATLGLQTRAVGWTSWDTGATALTNADLVQVWSGADWLVFYYNSSRTRWELVTDTGADPTRDTFAIPAGRPIMIRRLGTAAAPIDKLIQLPMPYTL